MGIRDLNRLLKSNRLLFDMRRDPQLLKRFKDDLEAVMEEYGLTDDEKSAFRSRDLGRLAQLGVHPYMIPQTSRMFYGGAYNYNESEAALKYKQALVDGAEK
jgi:hypothetical protein